MTPEQIKKSIDTNQLQLTNNWDRFSHYGIVLFLICISVISLYVSFSNILKGRKISIDNWTIGFFVVPLIFAFFFYRLQKKRLNFSSIDTNLSVDEIIKLLDNLSIEQKWTVETKNSHIYFAKTNPSIWSGSWGEQITILFDKGRVLINSICDLEKRSSVVSMGRNRKNVASIIDRIKVNS
jgi:hypothetical protein